MIGADDDASASSVQSDSEMLFKLQEGLRAIEHRDDNRVYAVTIAHFVGLAALIAFLLGHDPFQSHPWCIVAVSIPLSITACFYTAILTAQLHAHYVMQDLCLQVLPEGGCLKDLRDEFLKYGLLVDRRSKEYAAPEILQNPGGFKSHLGEYWQSMKRWRGNYHLLPNISVGFFVNALILVVGLLTHSHAGEVRF